MSNGVIITPILSTQYRLSRVYSGGQDYQRYNRIILFGPYGDRGNAKFIEGFGANEFIVEGDKSTFSFRKQTSTPVMLHEFDRFRVIGDYRNAGPVLRSWLSITIVPWGLDVDYEHDVFNCGMRDCDASHGQEIDAYNATEYGTNTDINFYDRDVQTICGQRNIMEERHKISPTPPNEWMTEQILETL
ncbi:MAG: hypothetical protein DRP56_03770 [Planctomycetota bacterium]|nr:MAG: hypothetical protein DRP56_03770 [Planctomycetota bacterium]